MANVTKNHEPILALDPGLRDLGYAILVGHHLLTAGVLPLRHMAPSRRLRAVDDALGRFIHGYRPRTLVLEQIPRRTLDTLGGLPALGRRLRRLAKRSRLTCATYSPRAIRRTVTGNGWAGKREVAEILTKRYPELRVYLTQDRKWKVAHWANLFDALAAGRHHQLINQPPSRSRISG